jgi:hypothetical protein
VTSACSVGTGEMRLRFGTVKRVRRVQRERNT